MKTLFALALGTLATTGCAIDGAAIERIEEEQVRQSVLLADQNALIEENAVLLAQQIETQQQLVEMLADIDGTLRENRERTAQLWRVLDRGRRDDPTRSEPTAVVNHEGKTVLGRNEWVWLELLGRNLKARVDTGALSSSLSAVDLQPFERDGKDWIRFRVPDEEQQDGGEVYEAPLARHVRIRQASADELERRPVVRLKVRVGTQADETEFTLTNRANMLYPVLLGRNFLRDVSVVDVARKFVQKKHTEERSDSGE